MDKLEFVDIGIWKRKRPGRSELRESPQYMRVLKAIKSNLIPRDKEMQLDFTEKVKREEFPGYEVPARNMRLILIRDIWEEDVLEIGNRRLNYEFVLHEVPNGHILSIVNRGSPQVKATRNMKRRSS